MLSKLAYAVKVLRVRGPSFFWTYFVESVWFDLSRGTSTAARVPKAEQSIESSAQEEDEGLLYVASFTSVTQKTVSEAKRLLGADRFARAQFFDLGCGKGKALIVFSEMVSPNQDHPAIGIEYDPALAKLGQANIEKRGLKKDQVQVVVDSATNMLTYAKADTLVVYLYNSFQGETFRAVIEGLAEIPHVLIYVDPVERDLLPGYGYSIAKENKGRYNADTWLVATRGL